MLLISCHLQNLYYDMLACLTVERPWNNDLSEAFYDIKTLMINFNLVQKTSQVYIFESVVLTEPQP